MEFYKMKIHHSILIFLCLAKAFDCFAYKKEDVVKYLNKVNKCAFAAGAFYTDIEVAKKYDDVSAVFYLRNQKANGKNGEGDLEYHTVLCIFDAVQNANTINEKKGCFLGSLDIYSGESLTLFSNSSGFGRIPLLGENKKHILALSTSEMKDIFLLENRSCDKQSVQDLLVHNKKLRSLITYSNNSSKMPNFVGESSWEIYLSGISYDRWIRDIEILQDKFNAKDGITLSDLKQLMSNKIKKNKK